MNILKLTIAFIIPTFFDLSAQEKTLLYKISGKNLTAPSYLYGTIHAACPENIKITAALTKAMDETKQLYLEVDLDDPKMMAGMMKGMLMKDGHSINEYFTETEFAEFKTLFKEKSSMGVEMFQKFKPYMLASFLIPAMTNCTPSAWEMSLMKIATAQKETVSGLESVTDQLAIFDEIPYETQAKEVFKMLKDFEKGKEDFQKLTQFYLDQDVDGLYEMMTKDEMAKKFEEQMLTKRNENWVKIIPTISAQNATFYGVGAGHLGGKKGVLALLKAEGYEITPIENK